MTKLIVVLLYVISISGFTQEHARILEAKTIYTLQNDRSIILEESYKVKILSKEGYQHSVLKDYTDNFRKIEYVSIDIFDASNKKIKRLKLGDGLEIGLSPSNEISDAKMLIIDPEYKDFPFTIEVNKKITLKGFISLSTWIPRDEFNVHVDNAALSITYPKTMKINFREEFIDKPKTTEDKNNVTRTYSVSNLLSVDKKMRYQDFYDDQPKVRISPEKFWLNDKVGSNASWTEFGNWYLALNNSSYRLEQSTKNFIDRLDKSNKTKLVQNIYEFMQDKTRYVSIQLGIGGFKSLPTEDVEKYGYGDCKALSTYTKNMLEYAGVKSNYILARAGRDVPEVIADFPSNQFNHVYLGVPLKSDTLYLECTSQESPFNYTGSFTDDRNVLWIESNSSKMIRSKTYSQENNVQNLNAIVDLDSIGNATIKLTVSNEGIFFDELMIFKSAPSDYIVQYNQNKLSYSDFTIKDFKYNQPTRSEPVFNSNYTIQVKGLAQNAGSKFVLPTVINTSLHKYLIKDDLMKYCSVKRGLTVNDETIINLPSNYWAYKLIEPETINSKFGSYKVEMMLEGNRLTVKRNFTLLKGDYRKTDFEEFQKFYQKLEKLENKKLVLNSKT